MQRTYYGGAWSADGRTFFYTVVDHVYRPHQVWRHVVGTDPAADVLVLQEDDRHFEVSVRTTRCGQWVLIHAASRESAESWAIPAAEPTATPVTVGGRREGHEYAVESVPDGPQPFLAVTNHGSAREFTLSWVSLGATDPATWRSAIDAPLPGEREVAGSDLDPGSSVARRFLAVDAFSGHVVVSLRESGRPALYVAPVIASGLDWASARALRPAPGSSIELGTNEEFDAAFVTVVVQSRIDPPVWTDHPFDPVG